MPSLSFSADVAEPVPKEVTKEKYISHALLPFQNSLLLLQYRLSRCIQEIQQEVFVWQHEPRASTAFPIPMDYPCLAPLSSSTLSYSFSRPLCRLLRRLGALLRQARLVLDRIASISPFFTIEKHSAALLPSFHSCGWRRSEISTAMPPPNVKVERERAVQQSIPEGLPALPPVVPVRGKKDALLSRSASPDPIPDTFFSLPPAHVALHLSPVLGHLAKETRESETSALHDRHPTRREENRTSSRREEAQREIKQEEEGRRGSINNSTGEGVEPEARQTPLASSWEGDAMEGVDRDLYDSTTTFPSFPRAMCTSRLNTVVDYLVRDVVRGYGILEAPLRASLPICPTARTPTSSSFMFLPLPIRSVGAVSTTYVLPTIPFSPCASHVVPFSASPPPERVVDASLPSHARPHKSRERQPKDDRATQANTTAAGGAKEKCPYHHPTSSRWKHGENVNGGRRVCSSSLRFLLPPCPPWRAQMPHDRIEKECEEGSCTFSLPPMEEGRDRPFFNVHVLRIHTRTEEEWRWDKAVPLPAAKKSKKRADVVAYDGYHEEEMTAEEWEQPDRMLSAPRTTTTCVVEDSPRRNEKGATIASSYISFPHSNALFPLPTSFIDETNRLRDRRKQKNASPEEGGPTLSFPILPPRRTKNVGTKGKGKRREEGVSTTGMASAEEDEVNVVVSQVHSLVKEMKQQALQMNDWMRGEDRDALGKNEALLTEGVHQGEENMKTLSKLSDVHGIDEKSTGSPVPRLLQRMPYGELIWSQMILPLLDLIKQILLLCLIILLTLTTICIVFTRAKPSRYSPTLPFSGMTTFPSSSELSLHTLETPIPQGTSVAHTTPFLAPLPATVTIAPKNTSMTLVRAAIPAKNRTDAVPGGKTVTRTASTTTPHSTRASTKSATSKEARGGASTTTPHSTRASTKSATSKEARGGASTTTHSTSSAATDSSTSYLLPLD